MIRPFPSWLVRPEHAVAVVSPPYDGVSSDERRRLIETNPDTFLRVTRSPEDRPGAPADLDTLADESAAALADLIARDRFEQHDEPAVYVYELGEGDQRQTAVVGDFAVDDYDSGRIRVHELTRRSRAEMLAHNLERVRASSSPVAMAHRRDPGIASLIGAVKRLTPDLDFVSGATLHQRLWRVVDADWIRQVAQALGDRTLYIVDGHHRTAAASIVRRNHPNEPGFETFLGAAFAADELQVQPFHRLLVGHADRADELIDGLSADYEATESTGPVLATTPGELGVYASGRWVRLTPHRPDPGAIDVEVLQQRVLEAVLGVDPTESGAVDYVPGIGGPEVLMARAEAVDGLAITVRPVSLDQLMHEADAGRALPPKSTYFHPKARSGILLRMR